MSIARLGQRLRTPNKAPSTAALGLPATELKKLPPAVLASMEKWTARGLRFRGADAVQVGHINTVLNEIEAKLGAKTASILGLDPKRALTITVDMNRSGGENVDRDHIWIGPPLNFGVEAFFRQYLTHELGHHVVMASGAAVRVPDGELRFVGEQGKKWLQASGWSADGKRANASWGAASTYGASHPGEDFAEAFAWYVTQGKGGTQGWDIKAPNAQRLAALEELIGVRERPR